jgi:hypothetical protein
VSSPKSGLSERAGDGDADLREAASRQIIPVIAHAARPVNRILVVPAENSSVVFQLKRGSSLRA